MNCFLKEHPYQPLAHLVRVGGLAVKKRFHNAVRLFLLPDVSVTGSSAQPLELTTFSVAWIASSLMFKQE